jgi:dienelactone hydrolase
MSGTRVSYADGEVELEGYFSSPGSAGSPGVLVVPSWLNVVESTCQRADQLAELGYAAFVVDIFGAGVRPRPPQSPQEVVEPFLRDRARLQRRVLAGLAELRRQPECEPDRVAAIGYCLGGCGVLELARAGIQLRGVVSLHGWLNTPTPAQPDTVAAKILVLHGDADPVAPLDELDEFRAEMRASRANWEVDIYGGARHSFTGEGVLGSETAEAGLDPQAEARSWRATTSFLEEVLR